MAGKVGQAHSCVFGVEGPPAHTHTYRPPEIGVTVFHCQREEKGVMLKHVLSKEKKRTTRLREKKENKSRRNLEQLIQQALIGKQRLGRKNTVAGLSAGGTWDVWFVFVESRSWVQGFCMNVKLMCQQIKH